MPLCCLGSLPVYIFLFVSLFRCALAQILLREPRPPVTKRRQGHRSDAAPHPGQRLSHHQIRLAPVLPWSGSVYDFEVPYCGPCATSRSIRQERDNAERAYHHYRDDDNATDDDRRSQHRYDRSRLAYQQDLDRQEERDDQRRRAEGRLTLREEGRRYAGLDDPEWMRKREEMSNTGRGPRFPAIVVEPVTGHHHRRESQYRENREYRRTSSRYEPGTYMDRTGNGHANTSDPPRVRDEGGELSRRAAELRARDQPRTTADRTGHGPVYFSRRPRSRGADNGLSRMAAELRAQDQQFNSWHSRYG